MTRAMTLLTASIVCTALLIAAGASLAQPANPIEAGRFSGKKLGTVFNNDDSNVAWALDEKTATIDDYVKVVNALLDMKPGVLAQCVGYPDPVMYPSKVATRFTKYISGEHWLDALKRIEGQGGDVFAATIEAAHKRGIPVVVSYRMNAEDFYANSSKISDFGLAHPDWMIPGTPVTDPAIPGVYQHRMEIFAEVARNYDIDGLEFDFRRWYHMVSDPLKNHVVLTQMLRDTRKMLSEVAKAKHRKRLILGVRVGPSLDSEPSPFLFPGIYYDDKPTNASCKELGLDVKTWIKEGLVDYMCPSLFVDFFPGLPLTDEFAKLARGTKTGIYPTIFPNAAWMFGVGQRTVTLEDKDRKALALYKHDLCATVLEAYADGADGISTFNWSSHMRNAGGKYLYEGFPTSGAGAEAVQTYIYPILGNRKAVEKYMREPWATPPK